MLDKCEQNNHIQHSLIKLLSQSPTVLTIHLYGATKPPTPPLPTPAQLSLFIHASQSELEVFINLNNVFSLLNCKLGYLLQAENNINLLPLTV